MAPDAFLVHSMEGRLRLRVPSRKGDPAYFALLKEAIAATEGVKQVEVTPLTGSVLVRHDTTPEKIVGSQQMKDLFVLKEESGGSAIRVTALHDAVTDFFGDLDGKIKHVTGSGVDLPGLAFLGLVGAGIYQISRGNFTAPAWYTAFWYALGLFSKSGSKVAGKTASVEKLEA